MRESSIHYSLITIHTAPAANVRLRKSDVLPGIHFKIEDERLRTVRLNNLSLEFYEDRVLAKNRVFVHRLEIKRNKKRPRHVGIDALTALDAQHFRDFEQLHA